MDTRRRLIVAACAIGCASTATAGLISRGGGMVYDDVLNITWLANANQAAGSSFDDGIDHTDGWMSWGNAVAWATGLNHAGYRDWRLPKAVQPDSSCALQFNPGGGFPLQGAGFGCVGSELGHMFHMYLGGNAGESVLDSTGDSAQAMANMSLFLNIQPVAYGTITLFGPNPELSWFFDMSLGIQAAGRKSAPHSIGAYAWAVRDGDSEYRGVPVPATLPLLALGIAGLGAVSRRKPLMA